MKYVVFLGCAALAILLVAAIAVGVCFGIIQAMLTVAFTVSAAILCAMVFVASSRNAY